MPLLNSKLSRLAPYLSWDKEMCDPHRSWKVRGSSANSWAARGISAGSGGGGVSVKDDSLASISATAQTDMKKDSGAFSGKFHTLSNLYTGQRCRASPSKAQTQGMGGCGRLHLPPPPPLSRAQFRFESLAQVPYQGVIASHDS